MRAGSYSRPCVKGYMNIAKKSLHPSKGADYREQAESTSQCPTFSVLSHFGLWLVFSH